MSTVVVLAVIIGLAIIVVQARSHPAVSMPPTGAVKVTGFGRISAANPSSEPTSVVLSDTQASVLRSAVAALPRLSLPSHDLLCMEESTAFTIAVGSVHGGVMSTSWLAAAEICPAPGVLSVQKTRGPHSVLVRYCSLRSLITSFFPRGIAPAGTRWAFKLCRQ